MNGPMIQTMRLILIPATAAHVRAEMEDQAELGRMLRASVPDNWPPDGTADALPLFLQWLEAADPDDRGWFGWYAVTRTGGIQPTVIGGGGFLGPPEGEAVRMGYAVLSQFQRQGLATEMARGLIEWAFMHPGVSRILAETEWANPSSVRVLQKLGFVDAGPADEPDGRRFELTRHDASPRP